jgi:hypothetical protein
LKLAGIEGIFGFIAGIFVLIILQSIACTSGSAFCNNGYYENGQQAFLEIMMNPNIFILSMFLVICTLGTHSTGILISKYGSSLQRVTIAELKALVLWLFFLIYPGPGHEIFKFL